MVSIRSVKYHRITCSVKCYDHNVILLPNNSPLIIAHRKNSHLQSNFVQDDISYSVLGSSSVVQGLSPGTRYAGTVASLTGGIRSDESNPVYFVTGQLCCKLISDEPKIDSCYRTMPVGFCFWEKLPYCAAAPFRKAGPSSAYSFCFCFWSTVPDPPVLRVTRVRHVSISLEWPAMKGTRWYRKIPGCV